MRINLLLKITLVALVLLGLSLRSAVSAGGSDEEVFPPKTLEKLKKNYTSQQKKTKTDTAGKDNGTNQKSIAKESKETTSTKNKDAISNKDQIHYTKEIILDLKKKKYSKLSTKELALHISNKTGLPKKIIYNKIIEYKSTHTN